MTVYVDEILDWTELARARGLRHTHWCHLTADTEPELHAFAARLGLRRSWFQRKGPNDVGWHYDVTPNKRAHAVRLGAREVDHGFVARLMEQRRRERDGTTDVPGLCVYELPADAEPESAWRWRIGHHSGLLLAVAMYEDDAHRGAKKIAELADWTKDVNALRTDVDADRLYRDISWASCEHPAFR